MQHASTPVSSQLLRQLILTAVCFSIMFLRVVFALNKLIDIVPNTYTHQLRYLSVNNEHTCIQALTIITPRPKTYLGLAETVFLIRFHLIIPLPVVASELYYRCLQLRYFTLQLFVVSRFAVAHEIVVHVINNNVFKKRITF